MASSDLHPSQSLPGDKHGLPLHFIRERQFNQMPNSVTAAISWNEGGNSTRGIIRVDVILRSYAKFKLIERVIAASTARLLNRLHISPISQRHTPRDQVCSASAKCPLCSSSEHAIWLAYAEFAVRKEPLRWTRRILWMRFGSGSWCLGDRPPRRIHDDAVDAG